ncbi:MAG TPA: hypothetical protein VIH17_10900 [Candidatus Acidoferrales bacterium]
MHQLRLRFRVLADDLALFGQVDFHFQVLERHAIAEVAVQAVGLFDDGDAAVWILPKEAHHLAELFAACNLRRFHVHELAHELEVVRARIFSQELQLSRNRIPFALLVFAGNPRIQDRLSHLPLGARV